MTKKEKKELFLEKFEENRGLIALTCKEIQISPKTYYKWRNEDKKFDEACQFILDLGKEKVEKKLIEAIDSGDLAAIKFFLKCKGGYVEKQEMKVEGDLDLRIEL